MLHPAVCRAVYVAASAVFVSLTKLMEKQCAVKSNLIVSMEQKNIFHLLRNQTHVHISCSSEQSFPASSKITGTRAKDG